MDMGARTSSLGRAVLRAFVYNGLPTRVVFGIGSVRNLPAEVERLGARRVLLVSTPGRAAMVRAVSGFLNVAGVFDRAVMHTPVEAANEARELANSIKADCCVVVGGGSTIGFGKAIALTSGLPILAVPTTYSGSEMTNIWGLSEGGAKKTGRDPRVMPKTVIYDPELTLGLPAAVTAASGMNAIAHCVEGVWIPERTPVTVALAAEALTRFATHLPRAVADGGDKEARSECLVAAWLAGAVLTSRT